MKAFVDRDTCIACGLCEAICPEVFGSDDEGIATVLVDEIGDDLVDCAREAEESCPTGSISIED